MQEQLEVCNGDGVEVVNAGRDSRRLVSDSRRPSSRMAASEPSNPICRHKAARCSGDRPREAVSRNGKTEGEPLAGVLPILSDGLGVYCGVADGARGCYVGGVVCGALVAWDGCFAVPWLSWLYIVRGLQVLSRTGSAPPPSAAPAGGPEASFTSSGHAGCHAGATWTADLRAGRAGRSRVAGVGRPVAAAWPRSRVEDPAPSEMHL